MKALNYFRLFAAYSLLSFFTLASMAQDQLSKPESSFYLPFTEDWHYGNFTSNLWQTDSDNWKIDSQNGNEKPSAKFHRTGVLSNYSSSLLSNTIDAQNIKVGHVYLKFDLKLDDYNNNGSEYLKIKVNDSTGWHTIDSLSNTGSFDWETHTLDIRDYSIGQVFQFKFEAAGENSMNILDWYVDNIEVYRECDPPEDLEGRPILLNSEQLAADISWFPPESVKSIDTILHYDNGSNYSGIVLNDINEFEVAIRFDAESLNKHIGDTIKRIRIYLTSNDFDNLIYKIWTGQSAENEIYSDTLFSPVSEAWNSLNINSDIIIQANTEYWFGCKLVNAPTQVGTIGFDSGPAKAGKGDKIKFDGQNWENLSTFGLDYNWNIQVDITDLPSQNPETLLGFNIFRMHDYDTTYTKTAYVNYNSSPNGLHFYDTCNSQPLLCNAFYKVNGVWGRGGDTCITSYARSEGLPEEDFVFVLFTEGLSENLNPEKIKLYPNPISNQLSIISEENINSITIFSLNGCKLIEHNKSFTGNIKINTAVLPKGMYILKAETNTAIISRKIIKM